jgi:hypothetical protein
MPVSRIIRPFTTTVVLGGQLLSLSLIGCEVASSGDDEHHHPHHSHDQHRATFAESVAEIQRRSARFTTGPVATGDALHESKRKTLLNVIQRLPELAADTELRKREWDRVDAISKELLTILQPPDAASRIDRSIGISRIEPLIAELEQIVPLSNSSGFSSQESSAKKD